MGISPSASSQTPSTSNQTSSLAGPAALVMTKINPRDMQLESEPFRCGFPICSLLSLSGLGQLLLPPSLGGLSTGFGVKNRVPPPEAAGVVADELLVVHVVVLGTGPEGENVVQAPGELVAAVRIDGLEQTERDPRVHGQNVQVLRDGAPEDGAGDGSEAKNHDLNRRRVLSSQTERSRVLVMDLVDVLVQERARVHGAV
jgi:hypothetical protein